MGYVERIMGDNERPLYRTHQHVIVLLEQVAGALFAFAVFVALAIAMLWGNEQVRFIVGVIALGSLILPIVAIIRGVRRTREQGGLLRAIWWPVLAGLFILAFALLVMFRPELRLTGVVAVVVALLPLFWLVRGFLDWQNERYLITNRRVMEIRGIFNKLVRDSALEKVNDVELRQSVAGRLLGYGTVQIITGSDIGVNMFRRIANPVRFKREMLNAKEQLHDQPTDDWPRATRPMPAGGSPVLPLDPGPVATAPTSIGDRLIELSELRQQGLISEDEYQSKRRELLDQL